MNKQVQRIFYVTYTQTCRREINTGRIKCVDGSIVTYINRDDQECKVNTSSPHVKELKIT